MKRRASLLALVAAATLTPAAGCRTIESYLQTVHLAVGAETSSVRFYSVKTPLVDRFAYQDDDSTPGIRPHSQHKQRVRAFYNVSSQPQRLPFLEGTWVYQLFAVQASLQSPRSYRGILENYPDDGRTSNDPIEALLIELIPRQGVFARRMDYLYDEAQAYGSLYLGYFGDNFQIAVGFNFGQAYYSLLLIENKLVVTDTRGHWRPLYSESVIISYNLGRHFDRGLFTNTHIFLESVTELSSRHALQTQLRRSNGAEPDSLYLNSAVVRLGIRKTVELFETEPDSDSDSDSDSDDGAPEPTTAANFKDENDLTYSVPTSDSTGMRNFLCSLRILYKLKDLFPARISDTRLRPPRSDARST